MRKWLAAAVSFAFASALCVALSGCSSSDSGDVQEPEAPTEEAAAQPEAVIMPDEIDSGHVVDNAMDRTSDIWWKDGKEGSEGIYITDAANDAGRCVSWVDGSGKDVDSQFDCEISPDGHLVSVDGAEPACDIVFNDNLTCYDYVSGNWYIRGDADELNASLADLTFASESGSWTVTFNSDGTFDDDYDGEQATGTWEFITSANVRLVYDGGDLDDEILDAEFSDGQVVKLSNTWNSLSVQK